MCLMLGTWLLVSDVQEESASIDTRISNEDVVRNPVVIGQGRDLLPESLGPGGKLGPLRSSEEVSSSFVKFCNLTTGVVEKCETSALIWKRMVENLYGKRPSLSSKRSADDQIEPSKCNEFDTMLKKMKLVKIVDECPTATLNGIENA